MASIVINGDTSGGITLSAPAVAGSNTQNLVAATGTLAPIVSGTAVASTSGTSIDFTGIPSWAKRITVMFSGVSTSGTSGILIQIGSSGGIETSGYASTSGLIAVTSAGVLSSTAGFVINQVVATQTASGAYLLSLISSNAWVGQSSMKHATDRVTFGGGDKTLSGTLDRVRITTVNGTDTFDAGTINILYE